MAVSAVNGVKFNTHRSNITFGGEAETSPKHEPKRASNLVKVPVIVMMTLSPSLLNGAGAAAENYQDADYPQTELLAMASPEPQSRTSSATSNVISSYVRPELVQYKKSFRTENGKQYTMYWVDQNKDIKPNSKHVSSIYLVPAGYKRVNPLNDFNDDNRPPEISGLVLHDVGKGKEFLEAVVEEVKCDANGRNKAQHKYGIKLPDDIADDIIGVALGKTNYTCNPMLKKSISSTTSSTLTPLKITNFR